VTTLPAICGSHRTICVAQELRWLPEQVGDAAFLKPPRPGPDDQFAIVQQSGFAPCLFKGAAISSSGIAPMRWARIAAVLSRSSSVRSLRKDVKPVNTFFPRPGPASRTTCASALPSFHRAAILVSLIGRMSSTL